MAIEHNSQKSGRSSNGRVMVDEGGYQHLLSAIYDLVFAPTDWPIVLRLLAEGLNCSYAASITTTPERDTPRSLGAVGITADDHCEFLRTWHKRNVFGTRRPTREAGAIVLGQSILPKSALLRSDMYRYYLAPRKIEEVVRLDIFADPYRSQSISLGRPWTSGQFTASEIAFARALMPHLQRVATLHANAEDAAAIARTAMDALDASQAHLLLLDANGRAVYASAEADRLLHEADGLTAGRDGLRAATPALSARLRACLARAAGSSGVPGVSGALRLRRPSGKPDLVLVAIPARSRSIGPDIGRASVILQIMDPFARCHAGPGDPHRCIRSHPLGGQPGHRLAVRIKRWRGGSEARTQHCDGAHPSREHPRQDWDRSTEWPRSPPLPPTPHGEGAGDYGDELRRSCTRIRRLFARASFI